MIGKGPKAVLFAACLLHYFVATAATPSPARVRVDVLGNGLHVISQTVSHSGLISVRLVVTPPSCGSDSPEADVFTLLVSSMFRASRQGGDLYVSSRNDGGRAEFTVGPQYAVFSFDVSQDLIEPLFAGMRQQWTRGGVNPVQVDTGYEICWSRWPGEVIATEEPAEGDEESADDWGWYGIALGSVLDMFQKHMVASRLTLVIVGDDESVNRALKSAGTLEVIPEGEPVEPCESHYSNVEGGWHTTNNPDFPWSAGWLITDEIEWDAWETRFLLEALSVRLSEELGEKRGLFYSKGSTEIVTGNEFLIMFQPDVDPRSSDFDELGKAIGTTAKQLGDPGSLGWWDEYIEGERVDDRLFGLDCGDPVRVADDLADYAGFPGGMERLYSNLLYLPTPEEARRRYAMLIESARYYVLEPKKDGYAEKIQAWMSGVLLTLWRDIFGPDDRHRAIAFMCQCVLVLVVLRGANRWSTRKMGERSVSKREC